MFRLWIGSDEDSLVRGPIFPTFEEALTKGEQLAANYVVRIETDDGQWRSVDRRSTFAVGTARPDEPLSIESLKPVPPQPEQEPERRRSRRRSTPMPLLETRSVTWNRAPVTLVDLSWTGARVASAQALPHAGDIVAISVRAFNVTAQLAGRVRWVRGREFGLAFDETLMTRTSPRLLERLLGSRDA